MNAKTFSIWMMPDGTFYSKYNDIILSLSKKYGTIKFEPHVTLLGGIILTETEALQKTERLSKKLHPIRIALSAPGMTERYHQNLFIKVKKTGTLDNAYRKTEKHFAHQNSRYIPHLSLLYGGLSKKVRNQIIKEIGRNFVDSFIADKIYLYNTTGKEECWQKIKEFTLR